MEESAMTIHTRLTVSGLLLVVALTTPVLAADRPYDRDVAKLIDRANDDLGKFIGNMSGDAKGAKVNRGGVEYDVSDFLADLKAEGARLDDRFGGDAKAAPTALAFLQKAKGLEGFLERHPGFSGADRQWQTLQPTLRSLADAYQIDWSAEPDSWQAMRSSDAEIAGWAKQLDGDIKSYSSALTQAAKAAKIDRTARAALDEQVKALAGGAKGLQKALSARVPATNALDSLAESVRRIGEQASSLGLGTGASSAAAPLEATLGKLSSALRPASPAST
jgi:hypothetical protein